MNQTHALRLGPLSLPGWMAGALGAGLAIALTGWLTQMAGAAPGVPWLVAPMGASAVLVFMLPASPLAQPWAVAGGNLIAAATGLALGALVPLPVLAAALAVGLSIALMRATHSLHPPAGGTALVAALAVPAVKAAGWHFLLWPLGANLLVLIGCGWLWNRLTGHSWPHRATVLPVLPLIRPEHIDAVLAEWDEELDIDPADLHALIEAVERRARAGG